MEATEERHYIHSIAVLLALRNFKGKKDDRALFLSIKAVRDLADCMAIMSTIDSDPSSTQNESLRLHASVVAAGVAKALGIYHNESAGCPDKEWYERVRQELQDEASGDSGQWFSRN